jgi:hypothetical protein
MTRTVRFISCLALAVCALLMTVESSAQIWQAMPQNGIFFVELGAGGGELWGVGRIGITGVNRTFRWNGSNWEPKSTSPEPFQVEVSADGRPWILDASGGVHRWNGSSFVQVTGCATSIAVGSNDDAWVTGCSSADQFNNFRIYRWNPTTQQFVLQSGVAYQVGMKSNGTVWILRKSAGGLSAYQKGLGTQWISRGIPANFAFGFGGGTAQAQDGFYSWNPNTGSWAFYIGDADDVVDWGSWGPGPLYGLSFGVPYQVFVAQ